MPCFKPLKAWHTCGNSLTARKIVFQSPAVASVPIQLPCGRCIGCKLDRSLMWAIRSVHEAQLHAQNSFITLTYANEHLPWDGSLIKSHFPEFIAKLRRRFPKQTIRYFMCGEYGEKFERPHMHACLFGFDFPDKEIHDDKEGILLYSSEILEKVWGKGFCTIGELNFDTAAYTARYIAKKITGDLAPDHYTTCCPVTGTLIHLEPEYTTMSRRPGIAKKWYEQYKSDIYPSDFLIHQGKTIKTPRYYDNLYDAETPGVLDKLKHTRKQRAKAFQKDNTPERLAVREEIKLLNYKQLTRSYENNDT